MFPGKRRDVAPSPEPAAQGSAGRLAAGQILAGRPGGSPSRRISRAAPDLLSRQEKSSGHGSNAAGLAQWRRKYAWTLPKRPPRALCSLICGMSGEFAWRPAQRAGRSQPRVEAEGRCPGVGNLRSLRPEGPRERSIPCMNRCSQVCQASEGGGGWNFPEGSFPTSLPCLREGRLWGGGHGEVPAWRGAGGEEVGLRGMGQGLQGRK